MNPVSSSNIPTMLNPAPCPNMQGSVFQDVLNSSVAAADAQNIVPIEAVDVGISALDIPSATPAVAPLVEVASWVPSASVLQQPQLQAQSIDADEPKPVAIEDSEAAAIPAQISPAPIAVAPVSVPIPVPVTAPVPVQISVPLNTQAAPAVPPPRKKSADIAQAIDTQLTQPGQRPNARLASVVTKDIMPPLPDTLSTPMLDFVNSRTSGFDAQLGLSAATASAANATAPASTPIAELRQLVLAQDGEWIGALTRDIVSNAARDNHLVFTLMPENLGQLDVALTTDNGQVDIRIETSTNAAAQIIAADQARLIEDLRNAGLKLGQFDMSNRQNGNGQQQGQTPEQQNAENTSTPMQPKASSRAQGRFA